jgi:hypothetical protein
LPNASSRIALIHFPAEVFSVPTKSFISYELKTWLPYFVKRHILRRKIMKPPPIIAKANKDEIIHGD